MIRITKRQLINYALRKTYLGGRPAGTMAEAFEASLAYATVPASTPYLSLQLRVDSLTSADLYRAEVQERRLLRSIFMGGIEYLILPQNMPVFFAATQRQIKRSFNREWITWQVSQAAIETLAEEIMTVLLALSDRPVSAADIVERLSPGMIQDLSYTTRGGRLQTTSNLFLALRWLQATGRVIREPASDINWTEAPQTYALLSERYPDLDLETLPPEAEAQTALVRAYLAAFGPATEADIDFWTGLGKGERARATGILFRELTQVMVEGMPGTMLLLKSQADALDATPDEVIPSLYLLPEADSYIKAYKASRARFTPDPKIQNRIFRGQNEISPTILVNGQVIGFWNLVFEADVPHITWQILIEIDLATEAVIQAEVEALTQRLSVE